ncbi:MAG: hypothetical protein IPM91_04665 [Bacteroidetes bacterium]|nr:hypothetical protein [Bacteroidota bacterium]
MSKKEIYGIKGFYNRPEGQELLKLIRYKWVDNNLTEEALYNGDGSVLFKAEFSKQQSIYQSKWLVSNSPKDIMYEGYYSQKINNKGKVISLDFEPLITNRVQEPTCCYHYSCDYSENRLVKIYKKYKIRNSIGNDIHIVNSLNLVRNTHGDIIRIEEDGNKNKDNLEWAYKYDSEGNWYERYEYEIFRNDIEIKDW